jgi:hypothetical protein
VFIYDGIVFWDLLVTFREDYPETCPVFRFLDLPPLKGVSNHGRIETEMTRNYHPKMRVWALLNSIRELFDDEMRHRNGRSETGGMRCLDWLKVILREEISEGIKLKEVLETSKYEMGICLKYSQLSGIGVRNEVLVDGIRIDKTEVERFDEKFFRDE